MKHSTRTMPAPRPALTAAPAPESAQAPAPAPVPAQQPPTAPSTPVAAPRPGHQRRRRLPRARLTGLGCGVLTAALMVTGGGISALADGAPVFYGVLFITAATAGALWVRPADLLCAPIAAPIAFVLGLVAGGEPMSALTDLALRAPWLFAGTLTAALIVLFRTGQPPRRRRATAPPAPAPLDR